MGAPDFVALAQPGIQGLRAYDPGLDLVALRRARAGGLLAELGSNENSHGPSPSAREAILDGLNGLHRYPDPFGGDLKRALAARLGLSVDALMLGNGSHELLMLLGQVFSGPGLAVVVSQYGFAVHALAAQAAGAALVVAPALPRRDDMPRGHDLAAMLAAVGPTTRLLYLANPNNPTGTWCPTAQLEAFLAALPPDVLVVVDEAYIEYADDPALVSAAGLLARFPGLVITRTFSKVHALAALRVGYLMAAPGLVAVLERARESFNVNGLGLAAGEAALADVEHLAWVQRQNREQRLALSDALRARNLQVGPSQTNFVLVDFGVDAAPVAAGLVARGVVPRPMAGYGLPTCLRITVGTRDENRAFLQALDQVLG